MFARVAAPVWIFAVLLPAPPAFETRASGPCGGAGVIESTGTATFTVVGSDGQDEVHYADPDNLVFCQRTSETMVWIRLAQSPERDGEEGPHLDIDLCNVDEAGGFTPMVARARPCPGGKTWALWWHDGSGSGGVFANAASSTGCELEVDVWDGGLEGAFTCEGLTGGDGTGTVDIVRGSFRCEWRTGGLRPESHPEGQSKSSG